ncbi:MAG: SRPBCC family protein [Acidimicrobiia bacterium]|nr:SRPBCC family protein [Acidimicrobiia bacterium]
MQITEELSIASPVAMVFDAMADVRNVTLWNDSVSLAELTSAEPIGQGSQFITVNKIQKQDVTITAFERPGRLEFTVTGKRMDIPTVFTFAETDGGTSLVGTFDMRPKGLMKILLPMLSPLVRRELAKQHANFKELCEAQARSNDA